MRCNKCGGSNTVLLFTSFACNDCDPVGGVVSKPVVKDNPHVGWVFALESTFQELVTNIRQRGGTSNRTIWQDRDGAVKVANFNKALQVYKVCSEKPIDFGLLDSLQHSSISAEPNGNMPYLVEE